MFRGKNKFKIMHLFAGIGGIRLPFQELGGKCILRLHGISLLKRHTE
ncbi:hypothetical protein BTN50_0389 [Candidatus Enterovibrio altilux]|uniref:DNA (cytosine-5-)-methyltransferase n=1 Tax=Candidatus Enterovibrio altilux TaxID=1927128 RepID=A0A291B7D8_9GAMM|nr:hypothetical protein BTN50_0389 [Candidatus Enterovibrio luxaltus]